MKKILIVALLLFVLIPFAAIADDEPEGYDYDVGDMDFTIAGTGTSDDEFDNTDFNMEANLGFYLAEYLQLSLRQGFLYNDVPGDDDLWAASSRVGLDIVFDLERFKPFIGGSAGYLYGDSDWVEDQFVAGPEAGFKIFATESAFIFALVEYQFFFEDVDEADEAWDDGRFIHSLGVGFKF